jgi:hypothetical protein
MGAISEVTMVLMGTELGSAILQMVPPPYLVFRAALKRIVPTVLSVLALRVSSNSSAREVSEAGYAPTVLEMLLSSPLLSSCSATSSIVHIKGPFLLYNNPENTNTEQLIRLLKVVVGTNSLCLPELCRILVRTTVGVR